MNKAHVVYLDEKGYKEAIADLGYLGTVATDVARDAIVSPVTGNIVSVSTSAFNDNKPAMYHYNGAAWEIVSDAVTIDIADYYNKAQVDALLDDLSVIPPVELSTDLAAVVTQDGFITSVKNNDLGTGLPAVYSYVGAVWSKVADAQWGIDIATLQADVIDLYSQLGAIGTWQSPVADVSTLLALGSPIAGEIRLVNSDYFGNPSLYRYDSTFSAWQYHYGMPVANTVAELDSLKADLLAQGITNAISYSLDTDMLYIYKPGTNAWEPIDTFPTTGVWNLQHVLGIGNSVGTYDINFERKKAIFDGADIYANLSVLFINSLTAGKELIVSATDISLTSATASILFSDGTFGVTFDYSTITGSRALTAPDKNGTIAVVSDIIIDVGTVAGSIPVWNSFTGLWQENTFVNVTSAFVGINTAAPLVAEDFRVDGTCVVDDYVRVGTGIAFGAESYTVDTIIVPNTWTYIHGNTSIYNDVGGSDFTIIENDNDGWYFMSSGGTAYVTIDGSLDEVISLANVLPSPGSATIVSLKMTSAYQEPMGAPVVNPAYIENISYLDGGGGHYRVAVRLGAVEVLNFTETGIIMGDLAPDPSAMFQMDSTTQGFLPPRMTEVERDAIGTPAIGLLIYQTDGAAGLYYYSGAAWQAV